MKILKITKLNNFYKVKLDDDTTLKLHESVIIKYKLIKKGIEITVKEIEKINEDNLYYLALDKGVKYLRGIHSKNEVYNYLSRYFEKELVLKVIIKLDELKLLNDLEYAKYYLEYANKKGYGLNKIHQELSNEKIASYIIDEVMSIYDYSNEEENLKKVFEKYLKHLKIDSFKGAVSKIKNYLHQRGFTTESINKIIEENKDIILEIVKEDEALNKAFMKLLKAKKDMENKKFNNKVIRTLTNKGYPIEKVLKLLK